LTLPRGAECWMAAIPPSSKQHLRQAVSLPGALPCFVPYMLRCICVHAPSLCTLTGAPLPTLQQIPNPPTRPPLHASCTTQRSAKCLATANLVTRTEPVRVDYCAWEPFIQQREAQHMGHNLQQRPITPTHPPAPLCLATHAFTCSHTIRTQCYADVWAQAITPGCALASSNVPGGKTGQDKTHHQAASPPFPHTHHQPFNPTPQRSSGHGQEARPTFFCRQQDLTRPHQLPPQILRK